MRQTFLRPPVLMEKDPFTRIISRPRFDTYLRAAEGSRSYAAALYLYNLQLAEAFMFPLHMAEIALRNIVDGAFTLHYGPGWLQNEEFKAIAQASAIRHTQRACSRITKRRDPQMTPEHDDVVGKLTFDFWIGLLNPHYRFLWSAQQRKAFPGLVGNANLDDAYRTGLKLKNLRNKIAHHEPIFNANLAPYVVDIERFIGWMSSEVADWVSHVSKVRDLIESRPTDTPGPPQLKDLSTQAILVAEVDESVASIIHKIKDDTVLIVALEDGNPSEVATPVQLLRLVGRAAQGGFVDLEALTFADIAAAGFANEPFLLAPNSAPGIHAALIAARAGTRTIVGIDHNGRPNCAVFMGN